MQMVKITFTRFLVTGIVLLSGCGSTSTTTSYTSTLCTAKKSEIAQVKQQAEAGDSEAQYRLGIWFESACGQHNEVGAAQWFMRAAEQGHLKAIRKTADMYFYGWGVKEDDELAEKWYRAAAEQGDAADQARLGAFYQNTLRDVDKALPWYRRAADQGNLRAIRALGSLYLEGEEVKKDLDEAEKWYRLAYERNLTVTLNWPGWPTVLSNSTHAATTATRSEVR